MNDGELTPLQRLSIVGTSGMGALCYIPETYVGEEKALPELDSLQQMALDVLSENQIKMKRCFTLTVVTLEVAVPNAYCRIMKVLGW